MDYNLRIAMPTSMVVDHSKSVPLKKSLKAHLILTVTGKQKRCDQ